MDLQTVRKHIVFHGRVQGVGFRYYARLKATELGLTGWVENMPDGTVEMEVEGASWKIRELVHFLNDQRYIRIDSMDTEKIPLKQDNGFRVHNAY